MSNGKTPNYGGDESDCRWAYGATVAVVLSLLIYLIFFAETGTRGFLLLAILLGGMAGWAAGIAATPYNAAETARLSGISQVVSAAVTGYLLAKIDPLFAMLLGDEQSPHVNTALLPQVAVALIMFIDAAVLTYVTRSYSWEKQKKA